MPCFSKWKKNHKTWACFSFVQYALLYRIFACWSVILGLTAYSCVVQNHIPVSLKVLAGPWLWSSLRCLNHEITCTVGLKTKRRVLFLWAFCHVDIVAGFFGICCCLAGWCVVKITHKYTVSCFNGTLYCTCCPFLFQSHMELSLKQKSWEFGSTATAHW